MSIRLFGPRVLLKFVPVKDRIGRIFIPDSAGQIDTHRMGVVESLGDGVKLGLKVGQTVIFQVNDIMKWAQIYRRMKTGDDLLWMLESELIARINGNEVKPETIEILGHYVLFEPKTKSGNIITRETDGKEIKLELPGHAGVTPEYIKYMLLQKGKLVDKPIAKGQEIVVNHGRVSPLMVQFNNRHDETETREYGYTQDEWVVGCVEGEESEEADEAEVREVEA